MNNRHRSIFLVLALLSVVLTLSAVAAVDDTGDVIAQIQESVSDVNSDVVQTDDLHSNTSNMIGQDYKTEKRNPLKDNDNSPEEIIRDKYITDSSEVTSYTVFENVTIHAPVEDVTNITVINSTINLTGPTIGNYIFYDIYNSTFINTTFIKLQPFTTYHEFINDTFINVTFINANICCKMDNMTFINSTFINSELKNSELSNSQVDSIKNAYSIDNSRFENTIFNSTKLKCNGNCNLFENCTIDNTTILNSYLIDYKSKDTYFNNVIINHTRYRIGSMDDYCFVDDAYINNIESTYFDNVTYDHNFLDDYEFNISISQQSLTTGQTQHISGYVKCNGELLRNRIIKFYLNYREDTDVQYMINEYLITEYATDDNGQFSYDYIPEEADYRNIIENRTVKIRVEYTDEYDEKYSGLSERFKLKSIYEGYEIHSNITSGVFTSGMTLRVNGRLSKDDMPLADKNIEVRIEESFDGIGMWYQEDGQTPIIQDYTIYTSEVSSDDNGDFIFEYNINEDMIGYYTITFSYAVDDYKTIQSYNKFDVKNYRISLEPVNDTYYTGDTIYIRGNITCLNDPVANAPVQVNLTYKYYYNEEDYSYKTYYNSTATTDENGTFNLNYTIPPEFKDRCEVIIIFNVGFYRLRETLEVQSYTLKTEFNAISRLKDTYLTVNIKNNTVLTNNPIFTVTGKLYDSDGPVANQKLLIEAISWIDNYYFVTDENGEYAVNVSATSIFLYLGENRLTVIYNGNQQYKATQNTTILYMLDPVTITADIESYYIRKGDDIIITGGLYTYNNESLTDKTIEINIDDKVYHTITDNNGNYTIAIPTDDLQVSSYNIKLKYNESNTGLSANKTVKCELLMLKKTIITIEEVELSGYLNIKGNIKDEDGNPLINAKIYRIDTYSSPSVTDENGTFTCQIPYNWIKEDIVKIFFLANSTHSYSKALIDIGNLRYKTRIDITAPMTAAIENTTSITVKLYYTEDNSTYNILSNQNIMLQLNTMVYNLQVDDTGTYTFNYTPTITGTNNITVTYPGNKDYKLSTANTTIDVIIPVLNNTIIMDDITATIGQKINLTARIYYGDNVNTTINKGKVTFKVNGKTLKDEKGKIIYAKVTGGIAMIENFTIPKSWTKEATVIQAVYSGSNQCDKLTSQRSPITITATIPRVTTTDITAGVGETITLTANITDGDKLINTGKVVFKINGKTIKDANGKVIYSKVVNNQVNLTYTLPESLKAKEYNITAVFISSDYERLEDTKTLTITA